MCFPTTEKRSSGGWLPRDLDGKPFDVTKGREMEPPGDVAPKTLALKMLETMGDSEPVFTAGRWRLVITMKHVGQRDGSCTGRLFEDGREIAAPGEGEPSGRETPWGRIDYKRKTHENDTWVGWLPWWQAVEGQTMVLKAKAGAAGERQDPQVRQVAEQLRKTVATFTLNVERHRPEGEKTEAYDSLCLRVPLMRDRRAFGWPVQRIDEGQALKLIDYLVDSGLLRRAMAYTNERQPHAITPPCYTLAIDGGDVSLTCPLGWGRAMFEELNSLQAAAEGEALQAMARLLAPLAGLVGDEGKARATAPATAPAPVRVDPAEAEKMIQPALAQAVRDLHLNATSLGDVIPELRVEQWSMRPAWDLALKLADERYGGSPACRALFLASCIEPGFPGDRLDALKLKPGPGGVGSGSVQSAMYLLREQPAPIYLDFWLRIDNKQIANFVNIRAFDVTFKGATYSCLNFDYLGRLEFFERTILLKPSGELRIRGDGRSYQLIRISADGKIGPQEKLEPPASPGPG